MLSDSRSKPFLNGPTRSHLYSPSTAHNALRAGGALIIILGELGSVYWTLAACRWPTITSASQQNVKAKHVLLIADTQVQDLPTLSFRRVLSDLSLRKHWHVASSLKPEAVIFLGDMLANGKGAHNIEEYERDVRKFKEIFDIDSNTEVHYVPGNEDVGLGSISSISENLRSYYVKNFGPTNTKFVIANHTFIGLDAPGLVDEDYHRHANHVTFDDWKPMPGGPVSFVKEISQYELPNVILLSHIPLSRSETASCGPYRERGSIHRSAGPGYQSMLGKHTTTFLLKSLEPLSVFSGDNHDYCDYTHVVHSKHQTTGNSVREVTVKSFATSPHIKRPAFQLLSLVDPSTMPHPNVMSVADRSCLLPDQHKIYAFMYLPGLLIILVALLIIQYRGRRTKYLRNIDTLPSLTPSPRSSGRNTPALNTHTDLSQLSAIWSPYSPAIPVSPRATLPPDIRTPHSPSVSTTRLVASVPVSPAPSSPVNFPVTISYSAEGTGEGDDNDAMYPAQYATRRSSFIPRQKEDDEWSHIRDEEDDFDMLRDRNESMQDLLLSPNHQAEFLSAPSQGKRPSVLRRRAWSWSYTFLFRGRRRRISLSVPSWSALNNLLEFFGLDTVTNLTARKQRHGAVAFAISALSVLWPALASWFIINWTIFY